MRQRLISAAVLVPVVVIVFLLGDPWLTFGIAVLAGVAAFETARLMRGAGLGSDTPFVVVVAVALVLATRFLLNYSSGFGAVDSGEPSRSLVGAGAVTALLAIVVVAGLLALRHDDTGAGFRSWAGNVLGALYPGLLAALAGILLVAPSIPSGAALAGVLDAGRMWLLILVLTVWSFDTFAYVAGKYHGRGRFMNHISPNKTWSGVVGGTVAALLVSTLLVWAAGQQPLAGLVLGLAVAITAQAGDLAESSHQASSEREGFEQSHTRPWRRAGPGRFVPVCRAGDVPGVDLGADPCAASVMNERTRVAVLGSTGSIGRQTLDVLDGLADRFEVVALAAGRDEATFQEQIARFGPRMTALAKDGPAALEDFAAADDVDVVVVATTGVVSLRATVAALEHGKIVATANKETLVAGGHLVMPLARRLAAGNGDDDLAAGALNWLRPIDSEHSAIWQCLAGERRADVRRLIITASGGPFRTWPAEQLKSVTPDQALAHPTWRMGGKITIDSATLMNKALEVIEARWLYDFTDDQVDVVVQPQSIVHSLVEFEDGSLKAQLGLPDMRIPIQYALTYPAHLALPAPRVTLTDLPPISFEAPDVDRFPALRIGREAGRAGPRASAVLIAADDVAVDRFLGGSLDFPGIASLCSDAVKRFGEGSEPRLEELIDLDVQVRAWAASATVSSSGASRN